MGKGLTTIVVPLIFLSYRSRKSTFCVVVLYYIVTPYSYFHKDQGGEQIRDEDDNKGIDDLIIDE